jgi:NhaP-type Na+/H+ or K+/H+ antiporter
LALTVVCTVVLSIFAHGLTANPLAKRIAARWQQAVEKDVENREK